MSRPVEHELLIHAQAPSSAKDDVYYRALASAHLSFVPSSRTAIAQPCRPSEGKQVANLKAAVSPAAPNPSLQSADLSFQSVWENNSPRLPPLQAARAAASQTPQTSPVAFQTPPSVIGDSNPHDDHAIVPFCSPTRVLETYIRSTASSAHSSPEAREKRPLASAPDKELAQDRSSDMVTASATNASSQSREFQTLSSLAVAETPDASLKARSADIPEHVVQSQDPVVLRGLLIEPRRLKRSHATLSRADSEPLSVKRRKPLASQAPLHALNRSASDVTPLGTPGSKSSRSLSSSQIEAEHCAHLDIRPADPAIGVRDLTQESLITKGLEKLAVDLDINKRFKPSSQKRELRPFERGYWLLDCSNWGIRLSQKVWGFLWNYVGSGTAGWGVSCTRDENWAWIRIYCWGYIVGHVYLLLYLASERRILYTGGSWIGGDGEALIELGTREALPSESEASSGIRRVRTSMRYHG